MMFNDRDVRLVRAESAEDIDYLYHLADCDRYKFGPESRIRDSMKYIRHLWIGKINEKPRGVVFICYIPEINFWTFDAYRDDEGFQDEDNKGDYAHRAAKMILDWFFKESQEQEIRSAVNKTNRPAIRALKRLGFEFENNLNEVAVYKLRRAVWEIRQHGLQSPQ